MKKLDRYIFKQIFLSFSFFLLLFTLIFWINRAIRLFDRLIEGGHSSSVFVEFAVFSLPSISSIVFPFSCFSAAVYVTNRLKNDAEITIFHSFGLSPWRLLKPYLIFGIFSMLTLSLFTTLIVPITSKVIHKRQLELDSSVSARLLKEGKFIHPFQGVTFYIKKIENDGTLSNIFLHDKRNKNEFLTYTATRAFLAKDENKTALYMENGLIQTFDTSRKELSTTEFRSVTIDLSDALEEKNNEIIYLSHASTLSLIKNMRQVRELAGASQNSISLELHTRLHSPFFCLVAAILGFSSLLIGNYSKFGLSKQITLALSVIAFMKIIESYAIKLCLDSFQMWPLLYSPSLVGILASILFLIIATSQYRPKFKVE